MQCILFCILAFTINLPLWAVAADAPVPQPVDTSRADERFKNIDTENKGFISFEDFQRRHPNMQRPAFDAIDISKDGKISLEEWRTFFQSHGKMGTMPPGRRPPPGHDMGGQTPFSGREGEPGGKPLILPPSK